MSETKQRLESLGYLEERETVVRDLDVIFPEGRLRGVRSERGEGTNIATMLFQPRGRLPLGPWSALKITFGTKEEVVT